MKHKLERICIYLASFQECGGRQIHFIRAFISLIDGETSIINTLKTTLKINKHTTQLFFLKHLSQFKVEWLLHIGSHCIIMAHLLIVVCFYVVLVYILIKLILGSCSPNSYLAKQIKSLIMLNNAKTQFADYMKYISHHYICSCYIMYQIFAHLFIIHCNFRMTIVFKSMKYNILRRTILFIEIWA